MNPKLLYSIPLKNFIANSDCIPIQTYSTVHCGWPLLIAQRWNALDNTGSVFGWIKSANPGKQDMTFSALGGQRQLHHHPPPWLFIITLQKTQMVA